MRFKDEHPELQHLVRELKLLRDHNRRFREGDPQDLLLLFAECAVALLVIERFVRIIVTDATDKDTLPPLLEKATSKGRQLLQLPWDDREDAIKKLKDVRNTLLHANYEQAAQQAGCASVAEYFKTQFAAEVEALYRVADNLVSQIDPETGQPYGTA